MPLLAIYICSKCGEILEDQIESIPIIDVASDDVWTEKIHSTCGCSVTPKKDETGNQFFSEISEEHWLWAQGFFDY